MSTQKVKSLCRFTREMDEKLIQLVSENEVLYDTDHLFYKDLTVRDDVWQAISSLVGKSVRECKTRWRSLRDLYHRKKKDEEQGKRTRTPWEYKDIMKFLEKITQKKKSPEIDGDDDKMDIKVEFENDPLSNNTDVKAEEPQEPPPKRHRPMEDFSYDNLTILHLLREIKEITKQRDDPVVSFFDSMAKTVVKFPPAQAAEVKLKVCQIVTEMECKILEETGNYPEEFS